MWWCGNCQMRVEPPDVTNEEMHDERNGGCGNKVEWLDPAPPVCEDCQRGEHKHLESMKERWFLKAPLHEKLDSIDCKNIIDADNQCCCPETAYHHKRLVDEECR